jgi:hypothetical protein
MRSIAWRARVRIAALTAAALLCAGGCEGASAIEREVIGGPGGSAFRSTCSGDFVAGVYASAGAWITAIGLECAKFQAASGTFARPVWHKSFHGSSRDPHKTVLCAPDAFVSGIRFSFTREDTNPKYLDFIEITCTPVRGGPPATACLDTGEGCYHTHPNPAPTPGSFMFAPFSQHCPADEAAIGLRGRSGKYVDAIGLICGPRPVAAARGPLGKQRFATAKNDVDIYNEPVEPRGVIGMMRGGTTGAALLFALVTSTAAHAVDFPAQGGPGGTAFRSTCSGDFVVGVYIRAGAWASAIGLKCASFDAAQDRFRTPWNKAYHGGSRDPFKTAICPGERFVSGMRFGFTRDGSEPKYLDFVELFCKPVSGPAEPITICLDTGNGCWITPPNLPGGFIPRVKIHAPQNCPPGEAARGIVGRSGIYVDAVGVVCGRAPAKRA